MSELAVEPSKEAAFEAFVSLHCPFDDSIEARKGSDLNVRCFDAVDLVLKTFALIVFAQRRGGGFV